jgi:hypothetical protein
MRKATIAILLSLGLGALALARLQRSNREWFRNLKGWQKPLQKIAHHFFKDDL